MIASARARFSGGVLHPLEPLDLAEGQEVLVSIEELSTSDSAESTEVEPNWTPYSPEIARKALRATAGAWKGQVDGEALKKMLYEARRTGSREMPDP